MDDTWEKAVTLDEISEVARLGIEQRRRFSAKDAKSICGLSYRQLNTWGERGMIPSDRQGDRGWRRFSPKELFALAVANEIRCHYGIPVEKLASLLSFMLRDDTRNHLIAAVRMMEMGLQVYLLSDLEETFVMDSDVELEDLISLGFLRGDRPARFVLLRLNDIVNSILGALDEPVQLKRGTKVYSELAKMQEERTACTRAEARVLELLRQSGSHKITIHMKKGTLRQIDVERDETNEVAHQNGYTTTRIRNQSAFETIKVTRHDNRITRAMRTQPLPVADGDNKKVFFSGSAHRRSREKSSG